MVRYGLTIIFLFIGFVAFAQFPRFRLIQLEQSQTEGQIIKADTANNAVWSSDLRVQDSIFYIFGNPYIVDSTRLNLTKDTLFYYQFDSIVGFSLIDGDSTNEIQSIDQFVIINDSLYIELSKDNIYGVNLSPFLDNTDTSGYNLSFTFIDSILYITDGDTTLSANLSAAFDNTDNQQLSISNDTIFLTNSNFIILPSGFVDTDISGRNNTFTFVDSTITITDDSASLSINVAALYDNTDTSGYNRLFYITNDTLYIEDDNSTLYVDLLPYKNIQTLSITNDSLFISEGNGVDLSTYLDNTDSQTLSISNDTVYISNGNGIYIGSNTDTSGFNRSFTLSNDTLYIQDDNSTLAVSLAQYEDINTDTSGYNRLFVINNDSLYIQDDNSIFSVDLSQYLDNTDTSGYNSVIEILNDTLYIQDGLDRKFVSLLEYKDNTDTSGSIYSFTLVNDTLSITDQSGTKSVVLQFADSDTSGYNTSFTLVDSVLYLTDGSSTLALDIKQVYDNTDTSGYNNQLYIDNNTLYITDGNSTLSVGLPQFVNTDTSGINRNFYISNDSLYIVDDNSLFSVNLLKYLDNTDTSGYIKSFFILNDTLRITDDQFSSFVNLKPYLDNTDVSGYNESIEIINDFLILKDSLTTLQVSLAPYKDNTDTSGYNKSFYVLGNDLYIEDGNSTLFVSKNVVDNQQLSFSGDTLFIQRGNFIKLPLGDLNTDDQILSISNDTIFLENGGFVKLPSSTDTSGYNSNFYITNNILYIQDGQSTKSVDLTPYINTDTSGRNVTFILGDSTLFLADDGSLLQIDVRQFYDNTDNQQLSKTDSIISLTNGGSVTLLDDNPTNELQDLGLDGNVLSLSKSDITIDLSPFLDNTDTSGINKAFYISNDTLFIQDDESSFFVILPDLYNTDTSGFNKEFYLSNNMLYIVDDNSMLQVDLSPYLDNTDAQQLTKSNGEISLTNGGSVTLLDDDPTNELQALSVVKDTIYQPVTELLSIPIERYTIYLTNSDSIVILDNLYDPDYDPTNELQDIVISNDSLYIVGGNGISLAQFINTDSSGFNREFILSNDTLYITDDNSTLQVYLPPQELTKSNDTIFLSNDGFVVLNDDNATNELQTLSIVNDTLYISDGNGVQLPFNNIDSTRLNSTGDSLIYYFNDSIVRIDPLSTLIDVVSNCVAPLPTSTDVYALFDMSGSVQTDNVVTIINVLNSWHSTYKSNNPTYTGNLYTIPVQNDVNDITETYLDYLRRLRNNTIEVDTRFDTLNNIVMLPPWLDGSSGEFVAPTEMLLLAFVNETHPLYHSNIVEEYSSIEPTSTYNTHLNNFITEYDNMSFFKGVLYPIHQDVSNDDMFLRHSLAALNATTLTLSQIQDALGSNYEAGLFDSLTISNPYTTPLKDYMWNGVLTKNSPASSNFTLESFNLEINEILSIGDLNYVSVIQDYSNNLLTLRSIGSKTLDVTVDSTGCISIEYNRGDLKIYGDSITILGDGSMESPLFIDTNLIVTINALNDSLESFNRFEDSTRLNPTGDTLFYYQNDVIIGFGVVSRGNGLYQEVFIGTGTTNNIQLTAYDGLLPTDPSDILIYRNGLFIDEAYITALDPSTGVIQLSFTPELDDRIMVVWMKGEVTVPVSSGGLDSVFTSMRLIGNGTLLNPLDVDTMYVASKSYVDQQIAASGTGTITGVNEFDDATTNYGLNGGGDVGKVNLLVDTTVIAAKSWVTNQNYLKSTGVIGNYAINTTTTLDSVYINADTSILANKQWVTDRGYITENELITFEGDVSEVSGRTQFTLSVTTASNIRGGTVGDLLYQSTSNTTSKLALPSSGNYILVNGASQPSWQLLSSTNVGTATKLATARTINGISFDGTTDITITSNTPTSLTFNNSGTGATSGTTFNGSTARTISYNTIGAPSITGTNATGTWGISISGNAATVTNGVYTNQTYNNPSWLNQLATSKLTGLVSIANGGTNASTATDARTNLGATTVGSNFFTLTNPSAVRFIRINADNTVSTLTAEEFITAIGAGSSNASGTVTSIATNNGITGGTITTTGTIGLTGQALAFHNLSLNGLVTRTASGSITSRSIAVSGNGISISNADGISGNPTITSNATSSNNGSTVVFRDASGNFSAGTITATLAGNASTATQLQNNRTINGRTFNGTVGIVTIYWGTSRNITIGNTTRSVNGSTDYSWSLSDIGAAATNQTMYVGTTAIPINRTSASQTLTGVSIDGQANRVQNTLTAGSFLTGGTFNGSAATTFNVDTSSATLKNWVTTLASSSSTGTTSNSLTFINNGTGAASGTTFNGSTPVTVSYNTIGAPSTTGTNASGTWNINISGNASTAGLASVATNSTNSENINTTLASGTMFYPAMVEPTITQYENIRYSNAFVYDHNNKIFSVDQGTLRSLINIINPSSLTTGLFQVKGQTLTDLFVVNANRETVDIGMTSVSNTYRLNVSGSSIFYNPITIFEASGTAPTASEGTIILEKNNAGGSSSIIFKSRANVGSDYGYIQYIDEYSIGQLPENSALIIGVGNDSEDAGGVNSSKYGDRIFFQTAGADRVVIDGNGRVGIGLGTSTMPSYPLDVNGEVNATGYRINGVPISTGGGTVTSVSAGTQVSGLSMTINNSTTTPSIVTSISDAASFRTAIGAGTLSSEVDGSVTNEGSLSVTAGTSTTSVINSNTSGSTPVTLQAGSNITLSESGNTITIASTGGSGTTINNNADNRIITGSATANTLEAESNLTFSGSTLQIDGTTPALSLGEADIYLLSSALYYINPKVGGGHYFWTTSGGTQSIKFYVNNDGTIRIPNLSGISDIGASNDGTLQAANSDTTLKEILSTNIGGIDIIKDIETIKYQWKDKENQGEQTEIGFNAQNLQQVLPEAAYVVPYNNKLAIKKDAIIATLVKAMQEQQAIIEQYEERIKKLEELIKE